MEEKLYKVHPSAIVDEGCQIGENSSIWHFSHIMTGAVIGRDCNIGQNVFVGKGVQIGNNVKIQNNVSVYEGVLCEDNVFLGPSMVFTNILNPRSFINRKGEFKQTLVRHGASIGANATILCGIEIGAFALIGAGTVVLKSVPDFALMVGNPARQIGWVSERGHKLDFGVNDFAKCPESGESYVLSKGKVSKKEF